MATSWGRVAQTYCHCPGCCEGSLDAGRGDVVERDRRGEDSFLTLRLPDRPQRFLRGPMCRLSPQRARRGRRAVMRDLPVDVVTFGSNGGRDVDSCPGIAAARRVPGLDGSTEGDALNRKRLPKIAWVAAAITALVQVAAALNTMTSASTVSAAPATVTIAFSNARSVPTAHTITADLNSMRNWYCAVKPVTGTRSMAQAIGDARAIEGKAGAAAVRAVNAGRDRNPDLAELDATGALTTGNTVGALAALMAAYGTSPKNGTVLRDLGSVIAQVGYPQNAQRTAQDAIALFNRADAVRGTLQHPMGISETATELNDRGFALMELGRWSAAGTALGKAVSEAPLLSEAKLNLGMTLMCQHKITQATHMILAGARRGTFGTVDMITNPTGDPVTVVPAGKIIDLSHGHALTLPTFGPYPGSMDAIDSDGTTFQDYANHYLALMGSETLQGDALRNKALSSLPALSAARVLDLEDIVNDQVGGGLAKLWNEFGSAQQAQANFELSFISASATKVAQLEASVGGDPSKYCTVVLPELRAWLDFQTKSWKKYMGAEDYAARAVWAAESHWETGIYANITNRTLNKAYTLLLEQFQNSFAYSLTQDTANFEHDALAAESAVNAGCADTLGPDQPLPTDPADPLDRCPPDLKWARADLKLSLPSGGSIEASFDCEKASVGVSGPGVLAPFGKLTFYANGSLTAVLGAKVGGSLGPLSAGGSAGAYITFNSSGTMTDVGVTASAKVGVGDISLNGSGKVGTASFANVDATISATLDASQ